MITIEKLLILKDVAIFKYTPDEILLELAACLQEQYVVENELIVKKGDLGNVMFIIAQGKVKVHDDKTILAELGEREVFGELAALSPEVRIASVSAKEDSLLLVLSHGRLYDMMSRNIGLVKGIIEVLCQRARQMAAK